ncbi:ACP S-malonyltransferase [Mycolicibacterium helvum]|uniref:Malonyl CoA-acyl carrier protein transacylase n=1 Tax=Mycolicibacterium helvum TaxID=1534349 RepID=A0A7I7SYK0_9MYCO|nr:acyltransferase domain-containing protein [Mycolicibacterium helvum]BBY62114.1 malonate decarboxylase subunit epsilon [Mycolicibacterium helvum]
MSLAFLFPGQGSQQSGMLHNLPDSPAVSEVLAESHSQLHALGLAHDLDSDSALESTVNVQLALLIAGVACARALISDHGLSPQFVAGHSVGAFAAAVTTDVITLTDAMVAVAIRGQLMELACAQGDWGMAALSGLPTRAAVEIAREVSTDDEPLWPANINSATQTVFSGTAAALHAAADAAKRAGALNYERLNVSVASHCPQQQDTARQLAAHLTRLPRRMPTATYLMNTSGRATKSGEAVLHDLAHAVALPVQWYDATQLMAELGVTCAIESRPGHVLSRLVASSIPEIRAIAVEDDDFALAARRARRFSGRDPYHLSD